MKIAIGTTNKLKIQAIENALAPIFPGAEFIATKVDSGVSKDPKGDEEGIEGALTRAKRAMEKEDADMDVGPEGITSKNKYGTFVYGYVVIIDKQNRIGIGASAQVMLPQKLEKMIESDKGLADAAAS
jgi:non-canonical (house-cleaning) NTP pyrophosphatase